MIGLIQEFNLISSVAADSNLLIEWVKAIAPMVSACITIVGVILTVLWSVRKGRIDAKYQYATKMLEMRVRQLNEFYAPMRVQLEQSRALYDKLKWALKIIGEKNPEAKISLDGFRLLDHGYTILHDGKYSLAKPLVEGIVDIGKSISKLIVEKSGLIEGGMTATFTEYMAHFLMLEAALKTPYAGGSDGWQEFGYYPRMLNREVAEGFKEVLRHFEVYQQAGDKVIWELLERIPKSRREAFKILMDNLHFYEANAEVYAQAFDSFDGSELQKPFIERLQKPANGRVRRILDAGCGSGRDTFTFINLGYAVRAFDVSPAMVRLCSRKIRELVSKGNEAAKESVCGELTFDEVSERNKYDGVWASASLLHISKADLPEIVQRLVSALKPEGVIFMSFKYGHSEVQFDSRHFSSFTHRELVSLLRNNTSLGHWHLWLTGSNGERLSWCKSIGNHLKMFFGGTSNCWINVVAKRAITK